VKQTKESLFGDLKEADLSKHLENGNGAKKKSETDKPATDKKPLAMNDFQLYEALNLLKGLTLLKEASPKE
jgi:carboxyl-terminal processing protease